MGDRLRISLSKKRSKEGRDGDIDEQALQHVRCGELNNFQQDEQALHLDLQGVTNTEQENLTELLFRSLDQSMSVVRGSFLHYPE